MDDVTSPEEIRVGSPFAVDPESVTDPANVAVLTSGNLRPLATSPETFYDVGPLRYTALGSVAAALIVLFFGLPAMWWFPPGGTLIASLGCLLSLFGLYSPVPKRAAAVLAVHALLFLICYGRVLAEG